MDKNNVKEKGNKFECRDKSRFNNRLFALLHEIKLDNLEKRRK